MTTTDSLLQITDATTAILTIMDSAGGLAYNTPGYRLKYGGYAPKVASKREVLLAGQTHYNEVEETLTIEIRGSTAADCFSKLETLIELLDAATRWYYGELVSPVVIKYQPKGSTLTAPCQRLILKAKPNNDTISLPAEYDSAGTTYWLTEITISFICRGLWHTSLGTDTSTQTAKNSGNIITFNMPGPVAKLPNPVEFQMDLSATAPITGTVRGYLLLSRTANQLVKIDASSLTGTHITSVADTGSIADGNVMRFTPTAVNENQQTAYLSVGSAYNTNKRLGFYCTFRCTTVSTAIWQCRVVAQDGTGTTYTTPYVTLQEPSGETGPQPIYLGSVVVDDYQQTPNLSGIKTFSLQMIGPSSIASTPKLDIDTIIIVGLDDDYTIALRMDIATSILQRYILIHNQPLSRLFPVVHQASALTAVDEGSVGGIDGNAAFYSISNTIVACWLATVGSLWRYGSSVPALININLTATRDNSYLIPQ